MYRSRNQTVTYPTLTQTSRWSVWHWHPQTRNFLRLWIRNCSRVLVSPVLWHCDIDTKFFFSYFLLFFLIMQKHTMWPLGPIPSCGPLNLNVYMPKGLWLCHVRLTVLYFVCVSLHSKVMAPFCSEGYSCISIFFGDYYKQQLARSSFHFIMY